MENVQKLVLLVEDEKLVSDLLKRVLESKNYKVLQALSGHEALDFFNNNHPNLILLDIMLPDISGEEVLKNIRQGSEYGKTVPIIILTNLPDTKVMEETEGFGVLDYIIKANTSTLDDIMADVEKVLNKLPS